MRKEGSLVTHPFNEAERRGKRVALVPLLESDPCNGKEVFFSFFLDRGGESRELSGFLGLEE
jgi:hypothetical protein